MRKALIPAFLLVLVAVVLGSTVFRDQVVKAATTPFQNVVVQNTNTNPIPVQQIGTSATSVSGTVGIDPSANTVKLGSSGNTVNLDSTDAANLANVESALGKLNFDNSGNLETNAQTAAPAPVTEQCLGTNTGSDRDIPNDETLHTLCNEDFYITDITATGMDDRMEVVFFYKGNLVLHLLGASIDGAPTYQLDLTHPLHVDSVQADCENASTDCNFALALLGNSTGN
jgi:hypothetical protein